MATWDPARAEDREWMREALAERVDWDLTNVAAVLGCEPTREACVAALEQREAAA